MNTKNPTRNAEGYIDMTAFRAIRNADRELAKINKRRRRQRKKETGRGKRKPNYIFPSPASNANCNNDNKNNNPGGKINGK